MVSIGQLWLKNKTKRIWKRQILVDTYQTRLARFLLLTASVQFGTLQYKSRNRAKEKETSGASR